MCLTSSGNGFSKGLRTAFGITPGWGISEKPLNARFLLTADAFRVKECRWLSQRDNYEIHRYFSAFFLERNCTNLLCFQMRPDMFADALWRFESWVDRYGVKNNDER